LCGVDEILDGLTGGMDTRLAEGGANLSIGQRQRIALARALVGQPRILLLDEADANLDPKAARALDRVLAEYKGTVLLITHRPDWLDSADVIWHLENGRLVESGTPGELARSGGPTARLFTPSLALAS
jgi:ABC-type bacteriocin/lantibiotic exporter with double-glycine peptidase domain